MPKFRNRPVDHVVDVRTTLEFWMGHLDGALHVPLDTLPEGLGKHGVKPTDRIVVYCAGGTRSAQAAAILKAQGFTQVVDGGGIADAKRDFAAA